MKRIRSYAPLMSLAVAVAMAGLCQAKTCTWTGGSTGSFVSPDNWSDSVLPESGDTIVFTKAVTINDGETVDVGASGYTFDNSAKVTICLTGSGTVIKRGEGQLNVQHPWTLTGNVRIEAGTIFTDQLEGAEKNKPNPFGSGTIEITGTGCLDNSSWDRTFSNPIVITGFTGERALKSGGPVTFSGRITSDSDFTIYANWTTCDVTGGISASGKTVSVDLNGPAKSSILAGSIDANIIFKGTQTVNFNGSLVSTNGMVSVLAGKTIMNSTSSWVYPEVAVSGAGTVLQLPGANKHTMTSLTIGSGALVNVSGGKELAIAMTVGGVPMADGDWTAGDYPETISNGTLTVKSNCKVWMGGSSNAWATASNWLPVGVPASGSYVMVRQAVSFTDSVIDIGALGVTIDCSGTVSGRVIYSGSGQLIKCGSGQLMAEKEPWTLTGGVCIESGELYINQLGNGTDPFGSGPIMLTGSGQLRTDSYGRKFMQDFVISNFTGTTAIIVNGVAHFGGTIRANCDFGLQSKWTDVDCANIEAPGKTVTLLSGGAILVKGTINGSVTKAGKSGVTLSGAGGTDGAKLSVTEGTLEISSTGTWVGTDVTVDGPSARLQVSAKDRLTKEACVALKNGGKLIVPANVRAKVAALTVDGVEKANGIYSKVNFATGIDGDGFLRIGDTGLLLHVR